jgi:hypothetical protein
MFISKLWRGEYSLVKTYWLFAILVNIVLGIPINLYNNVSTGTQVATLYYFLVYLFFFVGYNIVVSVALWRSASAYTGINFWKYICKFFAIINAPSYIALFIYALFVVFGGVNNNNSRTAFEKCVDDVVKNAKTEISAKIGYENCRKLETKTNFVEDCSATWNGEKFVKGLPASPDKYIAITIENTTHIVYLPIDMDKDKKLVEKIMNENFKQLQSICPMKGVGLAPSKSN